MRRVAESFAWPFRGEWRRAWWIGLVTVILVPLLFVPLLGYAVAATRAAEEDAAAGPPGWRLTRRLIVDGLWVSLALALSVLPFAIVWDPLARLFGPGVDPAAARVVAALVLALPWGLLALLHMPHATATLAATGRGRDMLDLAASIRGVRHDFATWNVAAAGIVTGWAIGLACAGALCVGIVPGIFYAILVSAHAAATLARPGPHPSPR